MGRAVAKAATSLINMKKLFYFSLLTVIGCGQPESINSRGKDNTLKESRFSNLLAQFKNASADTLFVFSAGEFVQGNTYKGTAIDSISALLLPDSIGQARYETQPEVFAVCQFAIDSNRTGLIARTPSEYAPTSIKLFSYDNIKDSLTDYVELADNWGDAGDWMIKQSWLFKDDSRHMKALICVTNGHDNSVDNPKDTTVEEQDLYYLLDLSKPRIDTISTNKKQLVEQFDGLLKRQPSR